MRKAEIDEILMPGDLAEEAAREERVRSGFWMKVRKNAGRIPFMDDVVAAYYCALDPETPTKVRGTLFAALAYFVLPVDSIPDFLAGFGLTDDITVLTVALSIVSGHLKESHREAARRFLLTDEQPE
ncbi:MAG: YkvA family protein [Pseudomonadota bacterium]